MAGQPPKKMGMSLYADLLEPSKQNAGGATISGAPVRYDVKGDGEDEAAKKKDASLKFQPIKRPQVQQKNNKPKVPTSASSSTHKFSSSTATLSASSPAKHVTTSGTPQQQPNVQRSNFEDWVGDEDDDEYYYQDNRQRGGGRRKRKKNKGGQAQENKPAWDWDDIYDPSMPNSYADYKGSEEQFREIRDWKARLYYHMRDSKKQKNGRAESEEDTARARPMNMMFAPPTNLNFAPPSFADDSRSPPPRADEDDDYYPPTNADRRNSDSYEPPASFAPPAAVPDDASGEDAYMRRMRMSGMAQAQPSPTPPPPPPPAAATSQAPQAAATKPDVDLEAKRAEAQAKIAAFKAKLQKSKQAAAPAVATPPATSETAANESVSLQPAPSEPPPPVPIEDKGSTISRAPVRYDVPQPQQNTSNEEEVVSGETDASIEADQPKSNRPGQKGFAERLLQKYGWEKGKGLGATGEGITTALVGKVDKRKKLSDKEGGGWAQPANMGKIVGGKRRKVDTSDQPSSEDDAKYGKMSDVIKLEGMLDGLDVQREIEENNLMQEIGDEMGGNYGNVERVFIWRKENGGDDAVFVKFTSQLSALRAVQGMDGVTFADNEVKAGFWDTEKFEQGVYV